MTETYPVDRITAQGGDPVLDVRFIPGTVDEAHNYIPYVTDRSLGRLRINPGFEPDKETEQWIYFTPTH